MAVKYSQQSCKDELDKQEIKIIAASSAANEDISLVDGGTGDDTIVGGSAIDFVAAGFKPGDAIYVLLAAAAGDNIQKVQCTAVTATQINLPTDTWATGEANSQNVIILAPDGGSTKNRFNNCNVTIFTGTQTDSPDDASNAKGAVVELITWYGITFASAAWNAADAQAELPIVKGVSVNAANTGSGFWFRVWFGESGDAAANRDAAATDKKRMDGSCGVNTGDLRLSTTTFTAGQPYTFNSFNQITKMLGVEV